MIGTLDCDEWIITFDTAKKVADWFSANVVVLKLLYVEPG